MQGSALQQHKGGEEKGSCSRSRCATERWGQERKKKSDGWMGITAGGRTEKGGGERTFLEGGGGGWVGFWFWRSDEAGEFMDCFAAETPSFFLGRQRHPLIFSSSYGRPAWMLLLLASLSSDFLMSFSFVGLLAT